MTSCYLYKIWSIHNLKDWRCCLTGCNFVRSGVLVLSFGEIYGLPLQGKLNAVPLHEKQAQTGGRNIAYPYSTPTLEVGGGWSTPRPGRSIPLKETHLIDGWVTPAAGLDVSGRYRSQGIWNPCGGKWPYRLRYPDRHIFRVTWTSVVSWRRKHYFPSNFFFYSVPYRRRH